MIVLIALDSFKGSLSARQACDSLAKGILEERPDEKVLCLPIADGGDGLIDCLQDTLIAQGWQLKSVSVIGPYGQIIEADYLLKDKIAIIEMARSSGLTLTPPLQRRTLLATSFGLGELIADAVEFGANSIYVGLGGSATNDLGLGAMQALGVEFFDSEGIEISHPLRAADLSQIASVNNEKFLRRFKSLEIHAVCDVDSPLLGPKGATAVFGPQKGIREDDLCRLEKNIHKAADLLTAYLGWDCRNEAGAGAAGGMGAALKWFFNARMVNGANTVLEMLSFDEALAQADLVITGEGSFDDQSLAGKAPSAVLNRTLREGKSIFLVAGCIKASKQSCRQLGFTDSFSLLELASDVSESMQNASALLSQIGKNWAKRHLSKPSE